MFLGDDQMLSCGNKPGITEIGTASPACHPTGVGA